MNVLYRIIDTIATEPSEPPASLPSFYHTIDSHALKTLIDDEDMTVLQLSFCLLWAPDQRLQRQDDQLFRILVPSFTVDLPYELPRQNTTSIDHYVINVGTYMQSMKLATNRAAKIICDLTFTLISQVLWSVRCNGRCKNGIE